MRVAFTPNAYWPALGGAEHHTRRLAEGLALMGDEVHVVTPNAIDGHAFWETGIGPAGPPREDLGGVHIHRIPLRAPWWSLVDRFASDERQLVRSRRRYTRALGAAIADISPEVVVTLPHLVPNVEETVALRRRASWKLAYAPMLHEEDPYWAPDQVRGAVAVADGIIALTAHERQRLVEHYGAPPETTIVLPPGVDLPTASGASVREPFVLFLGRRAASKRIEVLAEAMRMVWRSVPEARLVVAGPPPTHGADPAGSFPDDDRIEVIGRVSQERRDELLGTAAVVASASVIESFGITTLEAWARATPVVVADTPVRRSVVRDGVDGIVAAPDPAGMSSGILRLLTDPEKARRMGLEGRHRVATEFQWSRIAADLRDFLSRL